MTDNQEAGKKEIELKQGDNFENVEGNVYKIAGNFINSSDQKAKSRPQQNLFNLPYVGSSNFVGRETQLEELHNLLNSNQQVAITAIAGMGGIGKTELAVQYARRYREQYPGGLCWLTARDSDLGTQILEWAGIQLAENEAPSQRIQRYWREWDREKLLIVLDDVPKYDRAYFQAQIDPYLPAQDPRFKRLMTSRQQPGTNVKTLNLEVLSEAAALELLAALEDRGRVAKELAVAKELCQWLGYLPLGIELVGSYLAADAGLTLEETFEELQELKLEAESLLDPDSTFTTAQLGVAAAFDLSWQELSAEAQTVGAYLGLFGSDAFKWEWVEPVFCQGESEAEQKKAVRELKKLRRDELLKFNLLKANSQEPSYQLHSLIAEFFRAKLETREDASNAKQAFCAVTIQLAKSIPQTATVEDLARVTLAIPQFKKVNTELLDYIDLESLDWAFEGLARIYEAQNLFSEIERIYGNWLAATKKLLGAEHPSVATSLNNLAGLYRSQGRYEEAEPLYQQALAMRQKLLGAEHPFVATSLNNLAGLYESQGRYEEAEPLYQMAVAIAERSLGAEHPNTVTIRNNWEYMRYQKIVKLLELPETQLREMFEPEAFVQLMELKQQLQEED